MRETEFINQNKEKWNEFEEVLKNDKNDPEKLSRLFIETTDDLSFSRTYYPNRSVRVYLNGVAQQIFQRIYKNKKVSKNKWGSFWTETLPDALWYSRKQLLWSLIIFVGGFLIGILSSRYYTDFVAIILGENYAAMTEANIENGDPMAVYKGENPITMFLRIALNNIRVSFMAFILGIFYGSGTVLILLFNGVMVGAFIYFFIERDLFQESFLAIMLHGTIELSMIVLAGNAGLTLAKGLVFPKSYSRIQSFILSARQGIKIMLGVSAFLVIAAFIESFATRHTETPDFIRAIVIVLSLGLVIGYFVWYPWRRNQLGLTGEREEERLQPEREIKISYQEIKAAGKIFTETFFFFKKHLNKLLAMSSIAAGVVSICLLIILGENFISFPFDNDGYYYEEVIMDVLLVLWPWEELNNFFAFSEVPLLLPLYAAVLSYILLFCGFHVSRENANNISFSGFIKRNFHNALIASFTILAPFFLDLWLLVICELMLGPIMILSFFTSVKEQVFISSAVGRTFVLLKGNWNRLTGLFFILLSIFWICMLSGSSQLWGFFAEIISMNINANWEYASYVSPFVYVFFTLFVLSMVFPLMVFGYNLFYYTLVEINEANNLKSRIEKIGIQKRAYGLEVES